MAENSIPEEWRTVADFPDYAVSSLGRVKRLVDGRPRSRVKAGQIVKTRMVGPYPYVMLHDGPGRKRYWSLHVLVCTTFHGPKPTPDHEVAHWDGDHANPSASNLRWAIHSENMADCYRQRRAIRISKGKLSADDVAAIRARISLGEPYHLIAADYGISFGMVGHIKTGRVWGWL